MKNVIEIEGHPIHIRILNLSGQEIIVSRNLNTDELNKYLKEEGDSMIDQNELNIFQDKVLITKQKLKMNNIFPLEYYSFGNFINYFIIDHLDQLIKLKNGKILNLKQAGDHKQLKIFRRKIKYKMVRKLKLSQFMDYLINDKWIIYYVQSKVVAIDIQDFQKYEIYSPIFIYQVLFISLDVLCIVGYNNVYFANLKNQEIFYNLKIGQNLIQKCCYAVTPKKQQILCIIA
ncbi:hypothetical protein pb186bvf_015903 [Paramecium bursaria]